MAIPARIVFYQKEHVYAMVPLVSRLPGHVIIAPKRQVRNFKDLETTEIFDLSLAIKTISAEIERFHEASSTTVYFQNFSTSDDSINHMYVHVLARLKGDLKNNDEIYGILKEYDQDFMNEYNLSIGMTSKLSDTKLENLAITANKYKDHIQKSQALNKDKLM
eukprot:CAMPEP_0176450758 /NCGR_PEP_ID=MMETSP0127-20121128/27354_1 /TAXON_ID=938130 /ORGANISM="Platyophrya macrostoma, Strain WH" /LENGTH=162 /DNA_ID=CAMNT_0017838529 /DNA_START=63 /DNA_END=551 /DNA_ORIENTATION=-